METKKHENRLHALLSASGGDRWMNCTPSARLEEKHTEQSSVYAAEGTLAHELAELKLLYSQGRISQQLFTRDRIIIENNSLFTKEMPSQVEKYTDYILERKAIAEVSHKQVILSIEEKLNFNHIVPKGFGTGDAALVYGDTIEVIDLKYGAGVPVSADDNTQLKLYGIGALQAYDLMFSIKKVVLTIVQPRLNSISTFEISTKDLLFWAHNIVKPLAEKAFAGEGIQNPGSWCRWCKVKARCKAFANVGVELAKKEFAEPQLLTKEEMVEIHAKTPMVLEWSKAVQEYMFKEAVKGEKFPGLKLVRGTGSRRWLDKEKVKQLLKQEGKEGYTKETLVGILKVEEMFSVDRFNELLGPLIHKPPGSLKLVSKEDKRPEYDDLSEANEDFL